MFYPKLSRRTSYSCPRGTSGFFSDYSKYAKEIAEDSQYRCVYCDAKISEHLGGDGFQLDHFRPKSLFPSLECDPTNLVLACPACNRFKWNHWPVGTKTTKTYIGPLGFIDPFLENMLDFFEISPDGNIRGKKAPAPYIIRLFQLERPARKTLRRRRCLGAQIELLLGRIHEKLTLSRESFQSGKIEKDHFLEIVRRLEASIVQLRKVFSELMT